MGRKSLWTDELEVRALKLLQEGKSPYAIGQELDFDLKGVRAMFKRRGVEVPAAPLYAPWSDAEKDILRAGCVAGKLWAEISRDLTAAGFSRTPEACQNKASASRIIALRPKPQTEDRREDDEETPTGRGWPAMRGTDEERDARYVRLLLEEQLRMARARKAAA